MESEKLYNKYYTSIYRFSYRMLGDPENAGDITQETFLRLHKFLSDGTILDNPASWLYKVTVNLCRNHIKRAAMLRTRVCYGIDAEKFGKDPDYSRIEKIELVRSVLSEMKDRDQVILQLYMDGLSYAEIAEVMEMNVNSVGKTLSRAIKKLSALLKGERYNEVF